ncbi:TetR/AcrR family transcriptional regulator [Pseudomonas gingeri]|uniref:TetR/AcrR family transcriptional regulator n=1 Tax=Pseudomonas gingeri TaxID=117681 RepID=UPI0015A13999|nr:TetR/AcrR family transcriptional regulator [Pseudomonas gingeri]NVZ99095.1 TetR/AcrR family transcriptional regulator [Pseudomonas gingeri]NWA13140.1 TetR/AcrR family transcriptional regulator [Pseudomonas gingeri]NWA55401.1 TetR/AcrR family transcriptional regulator [Pseudomonas gingeri]NWA95745.1 TetR/AcrR family transcriptional regulator [Pseudomonas gingeri]NWB00833.1 TetR/AcrR family transcriptional regulator [Pseudomonas gingeri]
MSTPKTRGNSDVRQGILDAGQQIMAAKGYSAVGLNEILAAAGVPKGSFYHYFGSKDAFGEALLESYFEDYLADMDRILGEPGVAVGDRLMNYWQVWQQSQSFLECQGKCLAVKLGVEVADLSEPMRAVLKRGTSGITDLLAQAIEAGGRDKSLPVCADPETVAKSLYQLWVGASVMVKIARSLQPFETAMTTTRQILHLA